MSYRRIGTQWFPGVFWKNGKRQKTGGKDYGVNSALGSERKSSGQQMRVGVSEQQHKLEKQKAYDPNRRSASEPRQDDLGDERLHLEQQEGAQQDR